MKTDDGLRMPFFVYKCRNLGFGDVCDGGMEAR